MQQSKKMQRLVLVFGNLLTVSPTLQHMIMELRLVIMTVVDFKRRGHVAATLVEIHGLAHAWSGGAARQPFSDPAGPDATAMIWRFFAKRLR